VDPGVAVPTPTRLEVPNIEVKFAVVVLRDPVVKTFLAVIEFETKAFPWTWRLAPPATGAVPIPTFELTVTVKRFVTEVAFIFAEKMVPVVRAFEA
jgi:hypothetical protein